jgi:hypothetical protein
MKEESLSTPSSIQKWEEWKVIYELNNANKINK